MNVDDMIILSIDDHTVEPPDMFEGHVPTKYKDRAPRMVRNEQGFEQWVFEGNIIAATGLNVRDRFPIR